MTLYITYETLPVPVQGLYPKSTTGIPLDPKNRYDTMETVTLNRCYVVPTDPVFIYSTDRRTISLREDTAGSKINVYA